MKPIARLSVLFLIAVLIAACQPSGSLGSVPPLEPTPLPSLGSSEPDITPAPSPASPTPSASPSASPGPTTSPTPAPSSDETIIVRGYFVLGGDRGTEGLVPYLFEVPETRAVATAAMNELLAGDVVQRDGYQSISSAIPPATRLLGLSIANGVATVDLSGEFAAGGGSASTMYRLGQVVFTLTQFSTVDRVLFKVDGSPVSVFGSEGLVIDGPLGRDHFEEQLPAVFVDRPAFAAAIGNPARVTGTSNVFEATSQVAILDGGGRVLVEQTVTATCGTGCRGTFDVRLDYDVARAQWGTLRVLDLSAMDGSPVDVRDYPVWLTPAG